jgi:hypothetical protein
MLGFGRPSNLDRRHAGSVQLWPPMQSILRLVRAPGGLPSGALLLLLAASSARAQCTTTPLTVGTSAACASPFRYQSTQAEPYWAACAVRGTGGGDWDIAIYGTNDGSGNCFADLRATSDLHDGYVDFIAGDYSTNLLTTYYAKAIHASGPTTGDIEWDSGTNPNVLVVNNSQILSFTPTNLIECRDIYLEGGIRYRFEIRALGGLQARAYVVNNPHQAEGFPRWVERDSALTWTTGLGSVMADSSGFYGIVVTNENAGTGSVSLVVGQSLVGVGDAPAVASARITRVLPNPLRDRAQLAYELPGAALVRVEVVDLRGRIGAAAPERSAPAGPGRWDWDGRALDGARVAAGVYFARLVVDGRPADGAKLLVLP